MILVVDDHEESRRVLLRILAIHGYTSAGAANARDALQFLATVKPSLVIVDYHMPDMDGMSLFRAIRAIPHMADLPVIVFSASDGQARESALREGVNAWIVKGSLDWSQLHREIVRFAGPGKTVKDRPSGNQPRSKDVG